MVGVVKRIRARDQDEDGGGRHDRVGQDVEDEHAAEEQQDLKGTCPPLIGFYCLSEFFNSQNSSDQGMAFSSTQDVPQQLRVVLHEIVKKR